MSRDWDETYLDPAIGKGIFIAVALLVSFFFGVRIATPLIYIDQQTTINIYIPEEFNLTYYKDDNTTLYQSSYNIYLIMIGGIEQYEKDIQRVKHFINETLLAYFLDVSLYNLSYINDYHLLNGKNLTWQFEYTTNNEIFSVQALDFSIYNSTGNHYFYMDFGNTEFLNISLGEINNIYINEISCFQEYGSVYRPYLNYTYNGQNYLEKMAWNNTIII